MRVLVAYGSERGGTEEIARTIGEQLETDKVDVELMPAAQADALDAFDAVIVGGALYANRWHRDARRFALKHARELRRVPVWFFSSGPLDDSAARHTIPPTGQVKSLMERVGALDHATFGGRLAADAKGFPVSAMARDRAGDWRNPAQIRGWAHRVAHELPTAHPGRAIDHAARKPLCVLAFAVAAWALCGAVMAGLLAAASTTAAIAVHAIVAPLLYAVVSRRYFAMPGAYQPLPMAAAFTGIGLTLDLVVVAGLIQGSIAMFTSFWGTWLPFALIFFAVWLTGFIVQVMPARPVASAS